MRILRTVAILSSALLDIFERRGTKRFQRAAAGFEKALKEADKAAGEINVQMRANFNRMSTVRAKAADAISKIRADENRRVENLLTANETLAKTHDEASEFAQNLRAFMGKK